ncbi:glycosyltransferase [Microvirga antarctica]|uniref:glycosyltransferase n=1 Tax=Microvirga antarctica TaxID=2819233 RepID=UPI001B300DE7|nr:glycosyltransferase [Microvirga antarctica]
MTMLDAHSLAAPADRTSVPRVGSLAPNVVMIVLDVPEAVRSAAPLSVVEGGRVTPNASLRLTRADGGTRVVWVLRRREDALFRVSLSTKTHGNALDIEIASDADLTRVDAQALIDTVDSTGRVALVSTLFNVWGPLFRLQRAPEFAHFLRAVLQVLAPEPAAASVAASAGSEALLLQTSLPASFGKIDAVYGLSADGPVRLSSQAHRSMAPGARNALHLLVPHRFGRSARAIIVLVGAGGLSMRVVAPMAAGQPSLARWLSQHGPGAPDLRESLLIELCGRSDAGRAIALEAQLRAPLQARRVVGQQLTPTAEIVCALSTAAGTLVTGWYNDPADLVSGLAALGAQTHDLTDAQHRFPVSVNNPKDGSPMTATGFAVLAPPRGGTARILQPRFRLCLKSGSHHTLVPPPQPIDAVGARAVALRAVPPEHVSDHVLATILSPVIADLHAQSGAGVGAPTSAWIGTAPPRPKVSVVIPLYKVLDFLRFQIAAFAADPWLRANAELIFVLDSPDQAGDLHHLLGGFYLIYGMPMLVVVMERNAGYARACNTGAGAARGETLALVNSDVIPTANGWLEPLVVRLGGRNRIGAVGPRLLFEDGSIQHAGMYFAQDHRGRWLNHHFHKGMPGSYAPAAEPRIVPAVTGACLVMKRALYEQVGGFTEDYVIGDYEDSDLCLKITMTGRRIAYVPEVSLYHLERQSMSVNADYMRGIAWQYNCALHTARWGGLIAAIATSERRSLRTRSALS